MREKYTGNMGVRGITSTVRIVIVSEIPGRDSRDRKTCWNIFGGCIIRKAKGNAREALLVSVLLVVICEKLKEFNVRRLAGGQTSRQS